MERYTATFASVPLVPTAIAALAMLLVGALWYSPRLFGKAWTRHTGIRATDIRPHELRRAALIDLIVALIAAYLLGIIAVHATGNNFALFGSVVFVWLFVLLDRLASFTRHREAFALPLLISFRSLFTLLAGALVFYLWSKM